MPKKLSADKLLEGGFARAMIEPGSVNPEERRVTILISTETPVRRFDYWSGQYYEEVLLHGEENVDLTRAGTAKLRWMHGSGQYGELPIGKLENVTLSNRQLRAEAVFSQANPDADMFWHMVEEGTLTEISVGGSKQDVRITERDGNIALVEVTRWAFHEASLVDIGADPSAGIGRSENQNKGDFVNEQLEALRRQLEEMKNQGADSSALERKNQEINAMVIALADENKELKRVAGIRDLAAAKPGIMDEDGVKRFLDDKTKTPDDFARALLDAATSQQTDVPFQRGEETPGVWVVSGRQNEGELKRAIADSMILRAGLSLSNPHKDAEMFHGASMIEIARQVTGFSGYNPNEIIARAMSTSDFPVLLGNVANRVLVQAFEEAEGTFDMWTTAVDVDDFKTRTEVSLDMFGGRLKKLTEGGEKRSKETKESAESWRIYSRGAEAFISREMLINDDLGAFNDIILGFGAMAKRTANGEVYDLLQAVGDYSGYKMADGKPIFDNAHKNIGAAGVLSVTSLTDGRTKMRRQTSASGDALNISPAFLLVAPELETTALQLLNSESTVGQSNAGVANPFRNSLKLIVDSELSAAPWYLAAPRRTIKVGYLKGTNRRPVVNEKERNLSGIRYECVFDFGVMAEDYRGLLKNLGA